MTSDGARYELGARLGSGAAADVYLARDRVLGRDVALKILRPAIADDPDLARRFEREAATVRAIDHPNVVRVFEHGVIDGQPYLAMEHVAGVTLQQLLRTRGRLSELEARRIGAQIAAALDAAHACGIIHRDLKPANVLVAVDGTVKVSDFGVAHLDAATQLTRTGEVLGTPRYVAPEQCEGRVDIRTDIYALGIVLYEMVTGRPPFDGESAIEIVTKQMRSRPVPPRSLAPSITPDLETTILKALEKHPARRFASAATIGRALERSSVVAVPAAAAAVPAMAARVATRARPTRPARGASLGIARTVASIATTLLAILALTSGAVARWIDQIPVVAPAPVAATSTPRASATVTVRPTALVTPAPSPSPTQTARPSPTATPTARPTVTLPSSPSRASAQIPTLDPRLTIASFYALVSAKRYDEAAALWSPRMKAAYPPATNIYGRFDATSSIVIRSSSVASQSDAGSAVDVDIIEYMKDGSTRVWTGQWQLMRSGIVWLMDSPALRRA